MNDEKECDSCQYLYDDCVDCDNFSSYKEVGTDYTTYPEKIKMIKLNALCLTTWEVLFISDIEWITDDNGFSLKQKAVIDSIFYREN